MSEHTAKNLSIERYAKHCGIGKDQIRSLIRKDELPYFKVGKFTYINVEAADEHFKQKAIERARVI